MDAITQAPVRNTSFSTVLPTLQTTIDSTSLGEFKVCPRKYYYRMIEGWVPRTTSVHLQFGLWLHQGREIYERSKTAGADHEEALRAAVQFVMTATWDFATGRPWWSEHRVKNRLSLVQTLVCYLDQFGRNDPLQTIILANGKPAVELSFQLDFLTSPITDEPITLSGHLDRLVKFNSETYVSDIKTTTYTLGSSFFAQFSPDNQFSLYTLAGKVAFETPIAGVIVDACQITTTLPKFERQLIIRSEDQLSEWIVDTKYWINQMGYSAELNSWPMNDKSCNQYGGCPYRAVCSRPPNARQKWLETDYVHAIWDPAIARGDI